MTREILDSTGFNFDTAVFRDVRANYTIATAADGTDHGDATTFGDGPPTAPTA